MKTTAAGPGFVRHVGQVVDLPDVEAAVLVAAEAAIALPTEQAVTQPDELAIPRFLKRRK